jgi:hypothetical protein
MSRFSKKLHGYFSIDWSHVWFPYNEKPNQIRVNREKHMKHNGIDLDGENEPVDFCNSIVGNYSIDSYFGNFDVHVSPFQTMDQSSEIEKFS